MERRGGPEPFGLRGKTFLTSMASSFPSAFSLKRETALITGGGTGIGLAVAKAMHAAGARVTLVARREAELACAAAKSAMIGMIRTMATELSPHNVRVNAIAPGWIDTAMSRKAFAGDPSRRSKLISRTPLARLGDPEDVGWAAVYLTSPAAKFITGAVMPVDGGVGMVF